MIIEKNTNPIRKFVTNGDVNVPQLPTRSSEYSAGYDIFTPEDIVLSPGEEVIVDTGIVFCTSEPTDVLMIYPRSGQGFKHYLRLANTTGVIDADYEGTIKVKLRNESKDSTFECNRGTAIAQAIIAQYCTTIDDEPNDRVRGTGGFGSSDVARKFDEQPYTTNQKVVVDLLKLKSIMRSPVHRVKFSEDSYYKLDNIIKNTGANIGYLAKIVSISITTESKEAMFGIYVDDGPRSFGVELPYSKFKEILIDR